MGHKVHPRSLRLGYVMDWQSKWFSSNHAPEYIGEDFYIRNLIRDRFYMAAVSWTGIERAGSFLRVNIHTARPGLVIGKKGVDIEALKKKIETLTGNKVFVNVIEIKQPELDAQLVSEAIAFQLEKRAHYASAMKRAIARTMASKALGIKIMVAGRLGGSEIARTEWKREGRIPLHTLCADIDYGFSEANTISGKIGVKVWIFKKLHFAKSPREIISELRKSGEIKQYQKNTESKERKPDEEKIKAKADTDAASKKAEKTVGTAEVKKTTETLSKKEGKNPKGETRN